MLTYEVHLYAMLCVELRTTDEDVVLAYAHCAIFKVTSHLWWSMTVWEKRMCTCMCNWVTMLYSRKKNCIGEITIKKILIKWPQASDAHQKHLPKAFPSFTQLLSSAHLCMLESSGFAPCFLLYACFLPTWSCAELELLNAGNFQSYTFRPHGFLRPSPICTYHLYLVTHMPNFTSGIAVAVV